MEYKKMRIKGDNRPAIFIMSKRGKPIVRIRTGKTSDFGLDSIDAVAVFKYSKESKQFIKDLKEMEELNIDVPSLLIFGHRLESLYPKNAITYDLKDDDTDVNVLEKSGWDHKKYFRYMRLRNK